MKKQTYVTFAILLISSLLVSSVFALGIMPARTIIESENHKSNFKVINDGEEPVKVTILLQGDITEYISVSPKSFDLNPGERKKVQVSSTAEGIDAEGFIVVKQDSTDSGSTVSLALALKHKVTIALGSNSAEVTLASGATGGAAVVEPTKLPPGIPSFDLPETPTTQREASKSVIEVNEQSPRTIRTIFQSPEKGDIAVVIVADAILALVIVSSIMYINRRKEFGEW